MRGKNGTRDGHRSLGDVGHGGDGAGREAEPQQDLSQGAMDMAIFVGKTVGTIQGGKSTNPWEIMGQLPLDNVNPGFS